VSLATTRPVSRAVSFTRQLVSLYRDRNISFMAGSLAYAAFVSLLPLILLVFVAATVIGGQALQQQVLTVTDQYLTPASQGVVEQSLDQSAGRVGVSVVGLLALLWAVLKVFRWLDTAFSELYDSDASPDIVDQITDGLVVLGAMTTAILAMLAVGAVVALEPSLLPDIDTPLPTVRIVGFVALVVGLVVAFLPMYYVFPNEPMSLSKALPGAVVAALGWTLLQALFQVYVSMSSGAKLYGVLGGVVLLITWLYLAAVVVLLGVATNVVLSGRNRQPDYGESR
jgi:membrane protein